MKTARQAARQRRHRRRLMVGTAVALTAAGVLASLVLALLPDRKDDAASTAAAPGAGTPVGAATPTGAGTRSASTTPTATGTPTPTASATATAARPSSTHTTRPPRTASTAAPPAGRIQPGTTYRGVATAYEAGDGDGACLFGPSDNLMIAAMNTTDYETARACGAYVLVRAANGASVTVRITNECPLPCAPGQLDLSQQAFAALSP